MTATANEIIGCLVYRTTVELNKNTDFMTNIKKYSFWPSLVDNDTFHLWHFPGTQQEISQQFQTLGKDSMNGSKLKFPAILNFQGVFQEHNFSQGITQNRYNLAIVAPVADSWTTQQREARVYKLVLRPIEEEFIRQVEACELLHTPTGQFSYTSAYIPTTGKALNSIMKIQYGDYLDATELPNFTLKTTNDICDAKSDTIIQESKKVTDEIKNILK